MVKEVCRGRRFSKWYTLQRKARWDGRHSSSELGKKATSLGYYLAEDAGGKGIMTRSVKAVLHYAFENLKLNKIEIRCGVGNAKSRAIPERLGFKLDGILRDEEWLYDHFHDIAVYSLLASEWKEIR